jgi:ABC-type transporter MlaC component
MAPRRTLLCFPAWLCLGLLLAALASAQPAHAEDAAGFVREERAALEGALSEPPSPARDAEVDGVFDGLVDFDELTRRTMGEPCPPSRPDCEDLWARCDADQQREMRDLIEQLARASYRAHVQKTLDFDVTDRGTRPQGDDTRVSTSAHDRSKPYDPPVRIDYVLRRTPADWRVVDIVTEGSSLTKNYYDQFLKKMHDPSSGYPNIVAKLREKIAKQSAAAAAGAGGPHPTGAASADSWDGPPGAPAGRLSAFDTHDFCREVQAAAPATVSLVAFAVLVRMAGAAGVGLLGIGLILGATRKIRGRKQPGLRLAPLCGERAEPAPRKEVRRSNVP